MTAEWPGDAVEMELDVQASALVLVDMQKGYTSRSNVRGLWMRDQHRRAYDYFFDRIDIAVPRLRALIAGFRSNRLPVVHVTFGSDRSDRRDLSLAAHRRPPAWANPVEVLEAFRVGGDEHRIIDELTPADDEVVLNKTSHSAFTSTSIDDVLRGLGVSQVVIGGWATNACVELTARDAADRGYETFLVEDGCAAFTPESHAAAIRNFARLYGGILRAADVITAG